VKRFCLVRHGQTDWNLEGRFQGQSDLPLNQIGRAEARSLAGQLRDQSFAAIFTSDLLRAKETAEIIGEEMGLQVTQEPRLREINQGEWEGQFVEDIIARNAELWDQRTINPANFHPPGGESVTEVAERIRAAMRNIAKLYPTGSVLIVSHGLALATIICLERGIPVGEAFKHIPENAIPTWVDWNESRKSQ
jgi:alpha-ribazole phosphatase/probable phosphoglycerate mutase